MLNYTAVFFITVLVIVSGNVKAFARPSNSPDELKRLVEINQNEVITDEMFFGKYDSAAQNWVKKPMLNYNYSDKLKAVETAAKGGNYDAAARELLNYYQHRDFKRQEIPTAWNKGMIELWCDDIFGFDQQEKLVTVFEVAKKPAAYTLDVSGTILRGTQTYMLMGRHKDESVMHIASRESSNGPVLELFVNGKWIAYKPEADIYIRAGKYGDENYGHAKELQVCDSGIAAKAPFDDNTRRALISFDLSKVDPTKVEKARLKLYAWSDKAADKMILFHSVPSVVNEKDTWNTTLGYHYSWEHIPGGEDWLVPKGAHSQYINWLSRLYWFDDMCTMSIRTGDMQRTKKTIALLRDFIDDYAGHMRSELNTGSRLTTLCRFLPYLFDTQAMTPRDCVEIVKFMQRQGVYMLLDESQLERDNQDNQGFAMVTSMVELAGTFPELADSKAWYADAYERTDTLMKHLVMADGAYVEHTMGYPFPVLGGMKALIEFCKVQNIKLPDCYESKTHQLAKYLMNVSFPDGNPPPWGEGGNHNSKSDSTIKWAANYFNDGDLKWWCGLTKEAYVPKYASVHYPDAKIVVMRSGWQDDSLVMFVSPRVGGGHYHVDQQQVSLYGYGRNLLVDTGMSSYSSKHPHFDWQRHQGKSHNTVEVDEKGFPRLELGKKSHRAIYEGPCKSEFYVSPKAEYYKGWAGGYPNVMHNRSVLYLKEPGLYIVADSMVPNDGKKHTYDQCWHFATDLMFKADEKSGKVLSEDANGANVEILSVYPEQKNILIRKGFNAKPLIDTTYPSFRQQCEGVAEFYTLLYPKRAGDKSSISAAPLKVSGDGKAFEVNLPEGKGIYLLNSQSINTVKVNNFEIKAECAYIQLDKDGKIKYAVALNGESLIVNGKEVGFIKLMPFSKN